MKVQRGGQESKKIDDIKTKSRRKGRSRHRLELSCLGASSKTRIPQKKTLLFAEKHPGFYVAWVFVHRYSRQPVGSASGWLFRWLRSIDVAIFTPYVAADRAPCIDCDA
ncbi:hypothetical protein V2G26_009576 [Clonostachys chloroleuca]